MAFNKLVVLAVLCIAVQYGRATPVPHVHDFLKDQFEHGKQSMNHLKDKTVDAVETGVEKVKGYAAAGVDAVKSAGSTVAGAVVAPFHKVGKVLHKNIDYLANKVLPAHETEEHVKVPVPGYEFTPEHGLTPTAVTHEETHVYVKDPAPVAHVEEHKLTKEKEGKSLSLFKKIKNGLSTIPIINQFVGNEKNEVAAELPVYVYVSSLENTPYHEIHPVHLEPVEHLVPVPVTTTKTAPIVVHEPVVPSENPNKPYPTSGETAVKASADGSYSLEQTF